MYKRIRVQEGVFPFYKHQNLFRGCNNNLRWLKPQNLKEKNVAHTWQIIFTQHLNLMDLAQGIVVGKQSGAGIPSPHMSHVMQVRMSLFPRSSFPAMNSYWSFEPSNLQTTKWWSKFRLVACKKEKLCFFWSVLVMMPMVSLMMRMYIHHLLFFATLWDDGESNRYSRDCQSLCHKMMMMVVCPSYEVQYICF